MKIDKGISEFLDALKEHSYCQKSILMAELHQKKKRSPLCKLGVERFLHVSG
jgi:hypothetical protein